MALENIEYGSKASSEVLNNNFEYLDEKITTTNQKLETVDSQIQSAISSSKSSTDASISSLNTTLTNTLNSKVTELQNSITTAQNTANGKLSASISKKTNGYCKLSNGLIIQWGTSGSCAFGSTFTQTFPTAFSSASSYMVNFINYNTDLSDRMHVKVSGKSSTKFTGLFGRIESGAGGTRYAHFIAVGY